MSRIFLSHSSINNAEAVALRDWLIAHGWDDFFLDLDPERGLKAGERWQAALKEAAERCEVVIFLVSPAWTVSNWCVAEFLLAKTLNKRIFGVIIEPTAFSDVPIEITAEWHIVDLTAGAREYCVSVAPPPGDKTTNVTFSKDGLERLRIGLMRAGLEARYFTWPPQSDPQRSPYRGLKPLEVEDAGIFFGRDAPIVIGLDLLRGMRQVAPPRFVVILGASGAGKSSFMRAGLWPRLARENQHFLPLPVIRPERAVLTGDMGLISALETALKSAGLAHTRAEVRTAVGAGASGLAPLLATLAQARAAGGGLNGSQDKLPTLILCIDQAEELFLAEATKEARVFLHLMRDLTAFDAPALIALFTVRSDAYEHLQTARELEGVRQHTMSLPPMPHGAYAEVIKGPARRLEGSQRPLKIEEPLVEALLSDIEAGGAKDALPLLAFTLERLYREHGGDGDLKLFEYEQLGRIKGSIEAAVEQAFKAADSDARIPRNRQARLGLLRRGLIPWLAGIDSETGAPRRRIARMSEIPAETRPIIDHLVEQRLLATDVAKDTGEITIEPAHESLLRQWTILKNWLENDRALLTELDDIRRAARLWAANETTPAWLVHNAERLKAAERLTAQTDLAANFGPTERDYLAACRKAARSTRSRKLRTRVFIATLLLPASLLLAAISTEVYQRLFQARIALLPEFLWSKVLDTEAEQALRPKDSFKECAVCPEMVMVPAGQFMMGSPNTEKDSKPVEGPQHKVKIVQAFAISKFEITIDEWNACVGHGQCTPWKRREWSSSRNPVTNISWDDAQLYVNWLSILTGKHYRLLSEAEWEYAGRAGTTRGFSFETFEALIQGAWFYYNSNGSAQPVGKKPPNAFDLYDMYGNVWEWIQDCYQDSYVGAPNDGSARQTPNCSTRVIRGGGWYSTEQELRSAHRGNAHHTVRNGYIGLRVARGLPARPREPSPHDVDGPITSAATPKKTPLELQAEREYLEGRRHHEVLPRNYARAREWYQKAADKGSDAAMAAIGSLYESGLGVTQDYTQAREWYEKAAERGNGWAMSQVGYLYYHGRGVHRDYARAREWFDRATSLNFSPAMVGMGSLYENGLGVAQDYTRAREWYERAAERGNSWAMSQIGILYFYGRGTNQDYDKAYGWFEKAAERGSDWAMNQLGNMHYFGRGVGRDYNQARDWYNKAIDRGNDEAMANFGDLYFYGQGVSQDYVKAHEWYEKAVESGNVRAMTDVGNLHEMGRGVLQDYLKAREWYEKAAERGHTRAMRLLGSLYDRGYGVSKDHAKALEWFLKGAHGGDALSMAWAASLYDRGLGVSQNHATAREWYKKAAERGDVWSNYQLAILLDRSKGGPHEPDDAGSRLLTSARAGNEAARSQLTRGLPDWSKETRMAVQRELASSGFYLGAIDGVWLPSTLRAIENYLRQHDRTP